MVMKLRITKIILLQKQCFLLTKSVQLLNTQKMIYSKEKL